MMKRLFLVLGLLLATPFTTLAANGNTTHTWQFDFPDGYAYIWINVGTLYFYLGDTTPSGTVENGVLAGKTLSSNTYSVANKSNFESCLGLPTSPAGSYTVGSATSSTCFFAPQVAIGDTDGTDYYVINYGGNTSNGDLRAKRKDSTVTSAVADASLLVAVWPLVKWRVEVQSGNAHSLSGDGFDFQLFPGYWDGSKVAACNNDATVSPIVISNSASEILNVGGSGGGSSANTNYACGVTASPFLRVIPLIFGIELDPTKVDPTQTYTDTVTYTVYAP